MINYTQSLLSNFRFFLATNQFTVATTVFDSHIFQITISVHLWFSLTGAWICIEGKNSYKCSFFIQNACFGKCVLYFGKSKM